MTPIQLSPIPPNELRIGSWVSNIATGEFAYQIKSGEEIKEGYWPIPITEDLLLRMGFNYYLNEILPEKSHMVGPSYRDWLDQFIIRINNPGFSAFKFCACDGKDTRILSSGRSPSWFSKPVFLSCGNRVKYQPHSSRLLSGCGVLVNAKQIN